MNIIFDMPARKTCNVCLKDKHCSEFGIHTSRGKKYIYNKCKECHYAQNKANKEKRGTEAIIMQRKANKMFADKHKLIILIYSQLNNLEKATKP